MARESARNDGARSAAVLFSYVLTMAMLAIALLLGEMTRRHYERSKQPKP